MHLKIMINKQVFMICTNLFSNLAERINTCNTMNWKKINESCRFSDFPSQLPSRSHLTLASERRNQDDFESLTIQIHFTSKKKEKEKEKR